MLNSVSVEQQETAAGRLFYLHGEHVGHDAVHRVFCEGVKVFVRPPHELGLQSVAAPAVVLEHEEVQLHGQICDRGLMFYANDFAKFTNNAGLKLSRYSRNLK